jgi:hypothetical protein
MAAIRRLQFRTLYVLALAGVVFMLPHRYRYFDKKELEMKYTTQDVSKMIEDVKGHDDVVGHSSTWGTWYNISVVLEDNSTWREDR